MQKVLLSLVCVFFPVKAVTADLFMVSADTQSVRRYSDGGEFISDHVAPGAGGLVAPSGLAFGSDGNFYVADNVLNQIIRYRNDGTFLDVFSTDPLLDGPTDLVFHGDKLFVGLWNNNGNTGGVARVDAITGSVEDVFGTGAFRRTHSIAFDGEGNLFASNFDLRRIRVFDPATGVLIRDIGSATTLDRPMGITFNDDGQLIMNNWRGDVRLIDPNDGSWLATLVSELNNTQWNTVAPDGTLIIDSWNDQSLGRYDADGNYIGPFADLGVFPDKFIFHPPVPEPSAMMLIAVLLCIVLAKYHVPLT